MALGKIKSVSFGLGGYQGCMFGIGFDLESKPYSVSDFWGEWDPEQMPWDKGMKWTEETRGKALEKICRRISKLLADAKVTDVKDLVGKPIEIEFSGNSLKSWRILTEVL